MKPKLYLYLIVIISLSACVNRGTDRHIENKANTFENWFFSGKLGFRQKNNAKSAFINWTQQGDDFHIELYGPFGKGRTIIEKQGELVTFEDSKQTLNASSAEALFFQATGLNMPVSWLRWWLKGEAVPDVELKNAGFDEKGRIASFNQGEWQVNISKFTEIDTQALPQKLIVSNADYRLTLAIKSWQFR